MIGVFCVQISATDFVRVNHATKVLGCLFAWQMANSEQEIGYTKADLPALKHFSTLLQPQCPVFPLPCIFLEHKR